ncbi:hypothetical protein Rhopal_007211-T1 [Rhodotorula paludigena]|uniref:TRIP4/RQT4 C2HC5-type zinc finger domain-containing protein n=1 Tax=Rhodotorula paludigena TaxID=86838 RepID=A0AAV5GXS0_9BASI|nr:hypothetical protein Rhopal_007211-T1 [Rhodotorula paludigena]
MAPAALVASLAQLTGLDDETTREQLFPHLDSLQQPQEIRNYLDSLLAPGPAAQSFVSSYLAQRFPPPTPAPSRAGGSSTWAAPPPSPPPVASSSTRGPSPADSRQRTLERALASAPKGGKVYLKDRGDDDLAGWGGGGAKSGRAKSGRASPAGSGSGIPVVGVPTVRTVTAPRSAPQHQQQKGGKGKGKEAAAAEPELELSEEAAQELLRIDRALKSFDSRSATQQRRCFCQARQHPLSAYTPLCPSCALVLCTLNSPATASHIATLQSSREALLAREQRRAQQEREQAERERAAIRFPELGAQQAHERAHAAAQARSYATHAGGGGGLVDRIEREFERRAALGGGGGGGAGARSVPGPGAATGAGGRVLRLDGKTGKVKVQTKVAKPSGKGKPAVLAEETTAVLDPDAEADDGLVAWIDEDDDGVRGEAALRSLKGERIAQAVQPPGRVFVNVTLDEAERPLWIAPDEIDEADEQDDEEEGQKPSVAAVPAARPAVPGAATVKEEPKKRRRGKGGKGTEGEAVGGGEAA